MQLEENEEFNIRFWSQKIHELSLINQQENDGCDSIDDFIDRLDTLAVKYHVSSFGANTDENLTYARVSMEINLGTGRKFLVEINANAISKKNGVIKKSYLQLSRLHENKCEFLTNTFFMKLPYSAVEKLLSSFENFESEYNAAVLEYNKEKKLQQMSAGLIKSFLTVKFKNSSYDWKMEYVGNGLYRISILKRGQIVSVFSVTEANCMEVINSWEEE